MENPKKFAEELLDLINEFNKFGGCKVDVRISDVILCTSCIGLKIKFKNIQ